MNKQPSKVKKVDSSWMMVNKDVWLENSTQAEIFTPAVLVSFDAKGAKIKQDGKILDVKDLSLLYERGVPDDFDDMVDMEVINDAELLVNLMRRYMKTLIFTYVGPTLLVVNPFQAVPHLVSEQCRELYVKQVIEKHHRRKQPPHIYSIGAEAYKSLFENAKNQAIVISGESGAGKTENAKLCMNLLTSIKFPNSKPEQTHIEDKIMSCNPILEAFGNAKTVRNNNSSRFGKYTRIYISDDKKIQGADITNYLLEKSRLCVQGKGERNFHIFYHIIKGMTPEELEELGLAKDGVKVRFDELNYLNTVSDVDGIKDEALYKEFMDSVEQLGMQDNRNNILRILSGVLQIGDLQFDDTDFQSSGGCCVITSIEKLQLVSKLLSMSVEDVSDALMKKQITVRDNTTESPVSKAQCLQNRDSWAKELYSRLFDWLVKQLNQTIEPKLQCATSIGLLDIYGFEVFDKNGFEQLMINYTNEKLHQLYISYVFKQENEVFKEEGLMAFCEQIRFTDNQSLIEFLDKPPQGIFDLLDSSCQVKGDDDNFLQSIKRTHKDPKLIQMPKMPSTPSFIVVHTAKDVEYTVTGFRDKNMDEISVLTAKNTAKSANLLIAELFAQNAVKKDKSLTKKIRTQMTLLMQQLNSCDVHFVRCIKPNDIKKPKIMEQDYTLKQVRYLGVLDSLKVRKQNYPIRRLYHLFYKEYKEMTNNYFKADDPKLLCEELFKKFFPTMGHDLVLFGTNKIFIRIEGMVTIQEQYVAIMNNKNKCATKLAHWFKRTKTIKWIRYCQKILSILKQRKEELEARRRKLEKYKEQMGTILVYVDRMRALEQINKYNYQIVRVQRQARLYLFRHKIQKKKIALYQIQQIINISWRQIQDRFATRLQSNFKGHLCRKINQKHVEQIKQAKEDSIQRQIQAAELKKLRHESAFYIQGFMKMMWLSSVFQKIRNGTPKIQRLIRRYLVRCRAFNIKKEKYMNPLITQLKSEQCREASQLYSIELNQALLFDRDPSRVNQKAHMFSIIIDIEILSPQSDYYPSGSVSKPYRDLFIQTYLNANPIQSIQVGATHMLAACVSGKVYSWGTDFEGQVGSELLQPTSPAVVELPRLADQIDANEFTSFALASGKLMLWGLDSYELSYADVPMLKSISSCLNKTYLLTALGNVLLFELGHITTISNKETISQISAGHDFIAMLSTSGQLFTKGDNTHGQLGLGNNIYQNHIQPVKHAARISAVSAGMKHLVVKSNKIHVTGWNHYGQLGLGHRNDVYCLTSVTMNNIIQAHAARTSTILLTDTQRLFWAGLNQSIQFAVEFTPVRLKVMNLQNYSPVKVASSFSKTISTISITFVVPNNVWKGSLALQKSCLSTLTNKWQDDNINTVDPPQIDSISKYFVHDHMKKGKKTIHIQKSPTRSNYTSQRGTYQTNQSDPIQDKIEQISQLSPARMSSSLDYSCEQYMEIMAKLKKLKETPEYLWNEADRDFMQFIQTQDITTML